MTITEIAQIIQDEANIHGFPISVDVCQCIAMRLVLTPQAVPIKPGEIAQKYRERYEDPPVVHDLVSKPV